MFVLILRSDLACTIALDATATVALEENGRREIDIKRYAKVEKVSSFQYIFAAGKVNIINKYVELSYTSLS